MNFHIIKSMNIQTKTLMNIETGNHKSKKFGTTQDCNSVVAGSEGYCKFCDPVEKICVVCSRLCPEDKPNLDVEHCTCN